MIDLRVVTGYVPIPNHPRTAEEYGRLGENFRDIKAPVKPYYHQLKQCWMWNASNHWGCVSHTGDYPEKNTVAYHAVQHQKTEWLMLDALLNPEGEDKTFIWMDYGIFHQPGVNATVINEFLERVAVNDFAIPGCWSQGDFNIVPSQVCWRFCGSMLIVPRKYIARFRSAVMVEAMRALKQTKKTTWEVNTWAEVERRYPADLPIRWYQADHDETMFTRYTPHDAGLRTLSAVRDGQRPEGNERLGVQPPLLELVEGAAE